MMRAQDNAALALKTYWKAAILVQRPQFNRLNKPTAWLKHLDRNSVTYTLEREHRKPCSWQESADLRGQHFHLWS